LAEARLNIYGATARVFGDAEAVREIARDLAWFLGECTGAVDLELRLSRKKMPTGSKPGRLAVRWKGCRFDQSKEVRRVDYGMGAGLVFDRSCERGEVFAESTDLLRESAYLALHSRLGLALDRRGLHRVHGFGFTHGGKAGLVLLPSGGGKTSLALETLRSVPSLSLSGDDIPLLDGEGRLHPFPLRLGLRENVDGFPAHLTRKMHRRRYAPKTLVDVAFYKDRIAEPSELAWIILGERGPGPAALMRATRVQATLRLTASMLIGIGTPQILELLGPSEIASVFGARLRALHCAVSKAQIYRLSMGTGPAEALRALNDILDERDAYDHDKEEVHSVPA